MARGSRKFAALALALLLTGCATMGAGKVPVDPITITADTAAMIGEQARATNILYTDLCAKNAIKPEQCKAWADFFTKFKKEYALAHLAFSASLATGDIQNAQQATAALTNLATQLLLYTTYREVR